MRYKNTFLSTSRVCVRAVVDPQVASDCCQVILVLTGDDAHFVSLLRRIAGTGGGSFSQTDPGPDHTNKSTHTHAQLNHGHSIAYRHIQECKIISGIINSFFFSENKMLIWNHSISLV